MSTTASKTKRPENAAKRNKLTITMYTFGYWGCGQATEALVKAFDAAERARGFEPPLWVDIRFRRTCRAKGFIGNAFGDLLGPRYEHIKDLGNMNITEDTESIEIKNPAAAAGLLDLALADTKRHVIFFCACEHPIDCHRRTVSHLLLKEAKAQKVALDVIEWPGDAPDSTSPTSLNVPLSDVRKAQRMSCFDLDEPGTLKRLSIPKPMSIATAARMPWASLVKLNAKGETGFALIGSARFGSNGPYLPVLASSATAKGATKSQSLWRREYGYDGLSSK